MGRLIDADAFYRKLNDLSKEHQGAYNGAINDCMNLLDEQPTAYDVEKVVAELENVFPINPYPNEFSNGRDFGIKKAIDIVRRGCVE